jgi:hypothetical protein
VRFGPSETMQVSPSDTLTVKVYLLENNPSVVDGMVGNVSSSNWFFLLRFSFCLTGVFSSKVRFRCGFGAPGGSRGVHGGCDGFV